VATFFIILVSLLFSFFFSGLEIAYVSANKLQMHVEGQKETFSGQLFSRITSSPVRFLTTLLLGNTLAIVVFGIFTADVLTEALSGIVHSRAEMLIIQTIVSTSIILVVADFIPKTLFRNNPNRVLRLLSFPAVMFYFLLMPLTSVILGIANTIMRRFFRVNIFRYKNTFSKTDLHSYIEEHTTSGEGPQQVEHEVQIFRNALSFPDVKVRECMVPRVDAIAIDVNEGIEAAREKFVRTGLSRIIVYKENMDNVLGYVHFHEMFKKPADLRSILLAAPVIPESMPARDAIRIFMQQHKSMAVVVDEFGVNAGILTSEDVLEKIFGKIEDEYDNEELPEKKTGPDEYILSARLDIDYLNQKYHLNLPENPDYKTLGGYILHITGSIPKANQVVIIDHFEIKILSSTATRIEQVNLLVKKEV